MAPVARELAANRSVLEPIQTATSLDGQVTELKSVLENHGELPVTLIGFSWGAWLSYIVAARYPAIVKKLILVGSGPYEEDYAARLRETRLSRLGKEEKTEFTTILDALEKPESKDKDTLLARLGALASKTDTCDAAGDGSRASAPAGTQGDLYQNAWKDAAEMRRNGKLLRHGKSIICPVIAIHGDYDPHPAEGVQKPLSIVLKNFRFILLKNCGHVPWIERQAKDEFYQVLEQELR